jgi:glycosyltransferase involved in cell wall biosynthesis
MRLAVSLLNFRPSRIGGAETYLRGLVAGLARVKSKSDELILVTHRDNHEAITVDGALRVGIDRSESQITRARLLEAWTPYRARFAERFLASVQPDVVLFPQQSVFPKRVSGRCVLTVVDIQHLLLPQNISWAERLFRRGIYPYSLRRADHVLAISEFTRQTLLDRCRVSPERVTTVPLGYEPPATHDDDSGDVDQYGPYVYYPAATWPHKNHAALFRTVAALHQRGQFPFRVVLSGMKTGHWHGLERLIARLGLTGVVIHEGFVSRQRVGQLYRGAGAVLIPSQFEGLGLPVLEAVAYRKKTIVSRLPVFAELGVPETWQTDFDDPDQLRAALERPGPTRLERPPSTWDDCARATLDVLRRTSLHSPVRRR